MENFLYHRCFCRGELCGERGGVLKDVGAEDGDVEG